MPVPSLHRRASVAFIASTLTFGLLVSTAAKTQFQAFQMTIFFLPSLLLSGFMFPFDGMPRPARMLAEVLPLTHFVRIVRGIILRSADLPRRRSRDLAPGGLLRRDPGTGDRAIPQATRLRSRLETSAARGFDRLPRCRTPLPAA